jgi:hypothetical protein
LLIDAQKIWNKASRRSHEARKVAEAIRLVLSKVDSSEQRVEESVMRELLTLHILDRT